MIERDNCDSIVIFWDDTWHEARIPYETINSIEKSNRTRANFWEGTIILKDQGFKIGDKIAIKNILIPAPIYFEPGKN